MSRRGSRSCFRGADYRYDLGDSEPFAYSAKGPEPPNPPDLKDENNSGEDPPSRHRIYRQYIDKYLADHPTMPCIPLEILLKWCIITHEPWKEDEFKTIESNGVKEAHLVDRNTSKQVVRIYSLRCFSIPSSLNTRQ